MNVSIHDQATNKNNIRLNNEEKGNHLVGVRIMILNR